MGVLAYIRPCAGGPCTDPADAWTAAWFVGLFLFALLARFFGAGATRRELFAGLASATLLALLATAVAFQFCYYEDPRAIEGWARVAILEPLGNYVLVGVLAAGAAGLVGITLNALGCALHSTECGGPVYRRFAVPAGR